jgi:hypothetical protein
MDKNITISQQKQDVEKNKLGITILYNNPYDINVITNMCLSSNLNSDIITKVINCVVDNKRDNISSDIQNHKKYNEIDIDKYNYNNIFNYVNNNLKDEIVCIMGDANIILEKNDDWFHIYKILHDAHEEKSKKVIISLLAKNFIVNDNNIILDTNINYDNYYYSNNHHMLIFRTPIDVKDELYNYNISVRNMPHINYELFNDKYNIINTPNILKSYFYNMENVIEEDKILKNKLKYRVPDTSAISNISIETLCKRYNLSEMDKYHIKAYILSNM